MQRLFVGAADIHAGPPPHRLETFENLDMLGRITGLAGAARGSAIAAGSAAPRFGETGEQIAGGFVFFRRFRGFSHSDPYVALGLACAMTDESARQDQRLCHRHGKTVSGNTLGDKTLGGKTSSGLTALNARPICAAMGTLFATFVPAERRRRSTTARLRARA
jgi:hypothetical protein